ncbi:MAG TPA: sulfite exporter TauE/SafE family protein [Stellaceae bacterium]|nr:sulfite exporter TauE/SafE family protein [Stellaceae bacterium]
MVPLFHSMHAMPALAALCSAGDPLALLGIALALFGTALVGGFAHCAPMCAPFVLLQLPGEAGGTRLRRLGGGLLPAYHLGRLTTYTALGAALGASGGALGLLAGTRWALAALLALAALGFLLQALKRVLPPPRRASGAALAAPLARLAAPLLRRRGGLAGYALGAVLGFLPCGFLYAALMAASATGSAAGGAVAMAGFALGTVPALAAVGLLGAGVLQRLRRRAAIAMTPILLLNAAALASFALRAVG